MPGVKQHHKWSRARRGMGKRAARGQQGSLPRMRMQNDEWRQAGLFQSRWLAALHSRRALKVRALLRMQTALAAVALCREKRPPLSPRHCGRVLT
jgi:hypothetical protein